MTKKYNISIIGATGRAGKHIVNLVCSDDKYKDSFNLVYSINSKDSQINLEDAIEKSDIIIDFSSPESSLNILKLCSKKYSNKKLIIGTTGFMFKDGLDNALLDAASNNNAVFYSANMSIGIGLICKFFNENSELINDSYDCHIHDIHHTKKKDSPSGTALMLANSLGMNNKDKITDARIANIFGIHTVTFANENELIEIRHQSLNRELFADGSIKATLWLLSKNENRVFRMIDFIDSFS